MKQLLIIIGFFAFTGVAVLSFWFAMSGSRNSSSNSKSLTGLNGSGETESRRDLGPGEVRVEELQGMENFDVLFGRGSGMDLNAYRYAGGLIDFSIEMDGKVCVDPARTPLVKVKNITGLAGYFGWLRIPEGELQERWFFGNRTFVVPAKLAETAPKLSLFKAPFPDQDPTHEEGGGFGESIRDMFVNKIPEGGRQKTDPVEADGTPFPFPKDRPVCLRAFDIRRIDSKGDVVEKHRFRLMAQVVSREELEKRIQKAEAAKSREHPGE